MKKCKYPTRLYLLIDGRNIEIGKSFSFVDIKSSVIAFVKVYVLGQFPRRLLKKKCGNKFVFEKIQ